MASSHPILDDVCQNSNADLPSQPDNVVTISTSILLLLKCPVCFNSMNPPILQCSNGHPLCLGCKRKVHIMCPTCGIKLNNISCMALNRVAMRLNLPCKYQDYGCTGTYPYVGKHLHESQCAYRFSIPKKCACRPCSCPYADSKCTVAGDISSLVAHLKDNHKVGMHTGSTFNHHYVKSEFENATWIVKADFQDPGCLCQYFLLHFDAELGKYPWCSVLYKASLQFMGDYNEAKKYMYSLKVVRGETSRTLIQAPQSIRDSHRKVRGGLFIPVARDQKQVNFQIALTTWRVQ